MRINRFAFKKNAATLIIILILPIIQLLLSVFFIHEKNLIRAEGDSMSGPILIGGSGDEEVVEEEVIDIEDVGIYSKAEEDKYDEFKVKKLGSGEKFVDEDGNKQDYYQTTDRTPKIKFKRASEDIRFYEVKIIYSNGYWDKGKEKHYIRVDNDNVSSTRKERKDDYEVEYGKDYIQVEGKSDDKKLDKGKYYVKIKAFDTSNEYSETDEFKMKIVSKESVENDENEEGEKVLSEDTSIIVDKIGGLSYANKYSQFTYISRRPVTFTGHLTAMRDGTVVQVYSDGQLAGEITPDASGNFVITPNIVKGTRQIEFKTKQATTSGITPNHSFTLIYK